MRRVARYRRLAGLMTILGAGLCLLAAMVGGGLAADRDGARTVDLIRIDGSINPAVAEFIQQSIAAASHDNARALVIELDTPGGLLSSAKRIVEDLLSAPVPVIVYVAPSGASAASAGMFVTLAANIAAMAPGTTIGAAHPVELSSSGLTGAVGQKIENFTASLAQAIARQRGRNQKWVEDAVRESVAIGERQALDQHVIDIVARDVSDLLAQSNGREVKIGGVPRVLELADATVHRRRMTLGQRLLDAMSDPNLVYLLVTAGLLGIYFEFAHPGALLPGIAGAICLLLALASFEVLPINLSGLLLILLGAGLLMAEAFLPGYGVAGVGGLIAFVLGSLFLINSSETNLYVSRKLIAGAAIALAAIFVGIGTLIVRRRYGPVMTGREGLIGEVGEVRQDIAPGAAGRIFIHGENWRAVSDEPVKAGERVRVERVEGMEVKVRRMA
ncbi:MAG: nodulation protein NfeD [Candidatus Binataceae bacterium]|jgi:membrane-bound serine protease (ClpP class)